jgi:hypothetical protein
MIEKDLETGILYKNRKAQNHNNEPILGHASFSKGQKVTGVITSMKDTITLDLEGQEITVAKNSIANAIPGERRQFEVVEASVKKIILKEISESQDKNTSSLISILKVQKEGTILFAQKETAAKQQERDQGYHEKKQKADEIIARMTEKDYRALEQEGYEIEQLSIEQLYTAINRVKQKQSEQQSEPTVHNNRTSDSYTPQDISDRLQEANLPATRDSIQKVGDALSLMDTVAMMNEKAMKYLIGNGLKSTIENIYKAQYSSVQQESANSQMLSDKAWIELLPKASEVVESAGYESSKPNMEDARWLVESNLPLTKENYSYYKQLQEIKTNTTKETVLNNIVEGMKAGKAPMEAMLMNSQPASYEQLIDDIHSISDETIKKAVEEKKDISLQDLIRMEKAGYSNQGKKTRNKSLDEQSFEEGTTGENNQKESAPPSIAEITAKRQLEEIRLKMTSEAAVKLEKQGIHVETDRLEKVVEGLKEMEDSYYKSLLKEAQIEPSAEQVNLLKQTTQYLEQLKYTSSYVLGRTLADNKAQTIPSLLEEGGKLTSQLLQASNAYETLMTVPNSEYGDSLTKAFRHAGELLKSLGLEDNLSNQRAVRALGYNQMEINKESIQQIKAYDQQVNSLFQNLNPVTTVKLIKDGINPLELPIYDLNNAIDQINDTQELTDEKYSTYLARLEKEERISGEERKTYIGIYRLLHQIEKSDGAVLGSVIKSGREVTLQNLLSAVRTRQAGSVDVTVDDGLGLLESRTYEGETISEQLEAIFGASSNKEDGFDSTNEQKQQSSHEEEEQKEQKDYYDRLVKNLLKEISPSKMLEAGMGYAEGLISGSETVTSSVAQGGMIWEQMKELSLEKFYQKLQEHEEPDEILKKEYAGKLEELKNTYQSTEQSIRLLSDHKLPTTTTNLMLVSNLLSNGGSLYKKIRSIQKENEVENSENSLKEISELSDKLIDSQSMKEAYEDLTETVQSELGRFREGEVLDSERLAMMKSIGIQMNFAKLLAAREFYQIPIVTEQGITNVNLTIERGTAVTGRVTIAAESETLGSIKAEFHVKDKTLKGLISCDHREGLEELKKVSGQIYDAAKAEEVTVKQLDFGLQSRGMDPYGYQGNGKASNDVSMQSDTERILYRFAKACIGTIRAAEQEILKEKEIQSAG